MRASRWSNTYKLLSSLALGTTSIQHYTRSSSHRCFMGGWCAWPWKWVFGGQNINIDSHSLFNWLQSHISIGPSMLISQMCYCTRLTVSLSNKLCQTHADTVRGTGACNTAQERTIVSYASVKSFLHLHVWSFDNFNLHTCRLHRSENIFVTHRKHWVALVAVICKQVTQWINHLQPYLCRQR